MIEGLKPYPEMKDSGVALFGEVPKHWEVRRTKTLLSRNDSGVWGSDFDNEGVIVLRSTEQKIDGGWKISAPARRKLTEDEYRSSRLEEGDLVVTKSSGSSLHIGKTSLVSREIAKLDCCFSNFMQRLRTRKNTVPGFLRYALNCDLGRRQLELLSDTTTGLANLNREIIGSVYVANPTISEQIEIIRFLDSFDRHIKRYSRAKEEILQLLEEQKQAAIHQAITGKIDVRTGKPYATYKPSGVKWLGDLPEHWEVRTLRHVLRKVTIRNKPQLTLLSVVRDKGVVLRDVSQSDDNHNFIPDDLSNYKVVNRGHFAINKMKAWQGSYGVSAFDGIVSPAYYVFSIDGVNDLFFHTSIRSRTYIPYFTRASDGVRIGQWDLSLSRMREIPFAIPPIDEQTSIVRFLEDNIANYEKSVGYTRLQIDLIREYRTRLVSDVVTGKLDVREAAANLPSDTESLEDSSETVYINEVVSQVAG